MEKVIIKAKLGRFRMAPRKVRLAVNLVRGLSVSEAEKQLSFLDKKAGEALVKLLQSAVANAKQNFNLDKKDLFVEKIFVNAGATLKRWLPRAMGRATTIRKRTCSVELFLGSKKATDLKKKATAKKPSQPEVTTDKLKETKEKIETVQEAETKVRPETKKEKRPFGASAVAKKRYFSRQTPGAKKVFRRKSV